MAKKGPTAKRYDERTKKRVALAISRGKLSIAEARREFGINGGQTINGWLRKYAPDYESPRAITLRKNALTRARAAKRSAKTRARR